MPLLAFIWRLNCDSNLMFLRESPFRYHLRCTIRKHVSAPAFLYPEDKHLYTTLPSTRVFWFFCFLLLLILFPNPPIPLCPSFSMAGCWYSRGIVEEESFPGPVASSVQINQGTCSGHLTSGSQVKPTDRNSFFSLLACHSIAPCTIYYVSTMMLHQSFLVSLSKKIFR